MAWRDGFCRLARPVLEAAVPSQGRTEMQEERNSRQGNDSIRRVLAARTFLRAMETLVVEVAQGSGESDATDWVDQYHSPLGRRAHIEAIKSGQLPGYRIGRRMLARRSDLDAFVKRCPVKVAPDQTGVCGAAEGSLGAAEVAARALQELGLDLLRRGKP